MDKPSALPDQKQLKRLAVDEAYLPAAGKMNRSQRRALAKLQRKDAKLFCKIKQLETNLKRKPR